MNPMTHIKKTIMPPFVTIALACFALSPTARAVDPPPDGGYPNQNTAEGEDALLNLDTSIATDNTAIGFNALYANTTGWGNAAIGSQALYNNKVGIENTAIGAQALFNNVGAGSINLLGCCNTANGSGALYSNTTGNANTATGAGALFKNIGGDFSNSLGSYNTANGFEAMYQNTTGHQNSAFGSAAMLNNTTGNYNTANGQAALFYNTTGSSNTAMGVGALDGNTVGNNNTAIGFEALEGDTDFNSTGSNNTGIGYQALLSYTTGSNNVANGYQALYNNATGNYNTASGQGALFSNTTGRNNIADGQNALRGNTTGSNNVGLGSNAGINLTTGSNNIDIFDRGVAGEANTIRIGRQGTQTTTFIAGISGATVSTGVPVIVDNSGHLGTTTSSACYKEGIQPMDKASEAILALKPVTFRYKKELDAKGTQQFGLVAEDVEKVNPELVARDAEGNVFSVRYEAVNAMLLNEFLKEHRKVHEQKATIARLEKRVEMLAAGLQRVNAQLELRKPASQRVANNR